MAARAVVFAIEAAAPDAAAADTSTATARALRRRPACADANADEADHGQMTAATRKPPVAVVKDELPADVSGDG